MSSASTIGLISDITWVRDEAVKMPEMRLKRHAVFVRQLTAAVCAVGIVDVWVKGRCALGLAGGHSAFLHRRAVGPASVSGVGKDMMRMCTPTPNMALWAPETFYRNNVRLGWFTLVGLVQFGPDHCFDKLIARGVMSGTLQINCDVTPLATDD